ncbi:MAG: ABC transporter substrate-binding protein [Sideroxydans sp.]|nr:ABC transporter substrate-binding protein [Sideroxydans sp.]
MLNLVRIFVLFISCCGVAANARAIDLELYFPVAVQGSIATTLQTLIDQFEHDYPDIHVTPVYAGTYQDALAKTLLAQKNGKPPALAVLFAADVYTLIDAHAIVPFEEVMTANHASLPAFFPALMSNSRVAGKTWGIPFQRSTILLYWNKAMFREAGLDPDHAPQNWQEMTRIAQQLTRKNNKQQLIRHGIEIPATGFAYWLLQGMVTGRGARLMNDTGTQTYFDDPQVIAALNDWVALWQNGNAQPEKLTEWGDVSEDFLRHKTAMMWTTSGNLTRLQRRAKFDFGVAMLPGTGWHGSPTGGGNLYLLEGTSPEQQRAALTLVQWLVSPQHTAQWSIASGYIAVNPAAYQTELMRAHLAKYPAAELAKNQLEFAVPELSTHFNQRVTRALNDAIVSALTGEQSAQSALQQAQSRAVKILLPYQR